MKYAFVLIFTLVLTGCHAMTDSGRSVGVGNTVVAIILSAVFTAIAFVLGCFLDIIPVIGDFLRRLVGVAIILWWSMVILGSIFTYGWLAFVLAIIVIIILSFCCGGPKGFIVIFFG